jgi:hypothetical protein
MKHLSHYRPIYNTNLKYDASETSQPSVSKTGILFNCKD